MREEITIEGLEECCELLMDGAEIKVEYVEDIKDILTQMQCTIGSFHSTVRYNREEDSYYISAQ